MCTSANTSPGRGRSAARRAGVATASLVACLLAAGCAVGPDFHRPATPSSDSYGPQADPVATLGAPVDPAWWRFLQSPTLDALVETGLKNSPSLASARSALDQSRDQARAGAGVFFPGVDGGFSALRERSTPARLGAAGAASTFSLYTLSGAVSYAVDLFGGQRRSVESLNAAADRSRYAYGSAYLMLTGNIADAAIARAGYADQATAFTDIVRLETDQRDILAAEEQAGHAAASTVLEAEEQLAADRQSLALARQRQAAAESLLNTLLGREQADGAPSAPPLAELALPAEFPVVLPSQLVRARPDVLEAEAGLHQASAEVGVATAAMLPSIDLTGDYGAAQTSLSRLSAPAGRFWSIGPSINAPIFEGGALWYGRKAAQAGLAKAEADYRQTVLSALEQVSDQLGALKADAEIGEASRSAMDAAALDRRLADVNQQAGLIADIDAMAKAVAADRARIGLAAAKAQQLQDLVGLYVACGGGWTAAARARP